MTSYDQNQRPAELGFILTDLLLHYNDILMRSATEKVNLDLLVHGLQGHCSTFTDDDPTFKAEWATIQRERSTLHTRKGYEDYYPGAEGYEAEDLAYRIREISCLERSAYRMGIISKLRTNAVTWNPLGATPREVTA